MKRTITVLICLTLLGAATSSAVARKSRWMLEERRSYAGYNYVRSSSSEPVAYNFFSPVSFEIYDDEKWVHVALLDNSGRRVAAVVTQDIDGDGAPEDSWDICGETSEQLRVTPGVPIEVTAQPTICDGSAPASATSGKIRVTSYRRVKTIEPLLKTTREDNLRYTSPFTYESADGSRTGTMEIAVPTTSEEQYFTLTASDATGLPVRVQVFLNDDSGAPAVQICGKTERPLSFSGGKALGVRVLPGPCADGTPGAATFGEITLTLSNLP